MIEKDSADLMAKVAAMSVDLRIDRILEIADSHDTSDEAAFEAVKAPVRSRSDVGRILAHCPLRGPFSVGTRLHPLAQGAE